MKKKFPHMSELDFTLALNEFEKFFVLAAHLPDYFVPIDQTVDNIWHECILETKEYKNLCEKIRPGFFLHHSGMSYEEYSESRDKARLFEQDLTFLVSYFKSFGAFDSRIMRFWPMAMNIRESMKWSQAKFNGFLEQLANTSEQKQDGGHG